MVKRVVLALLALVVLAGVAATVFQRQLGELLFANAVAQRFAGPGLQLDDGLHLILCGTGSPLPNPERVGPCNAVIAGDQAFVVDIGEGGSRNLNLIGFDITTLDALLLTHYHSDHVDGIGPLALMYWTQNASTAPLPVIGPQGLERLVNGFNEAYALDHAYRIAHHGVEIVPEIGGGLAANPFEITDSPVTVLEREGLTITAFVVDHDPVVPAVGYRFDYKGRSVVISGDAARSPMLEEAAKGADILVHDALQPRLVGHMTTALDQAGNTNIATITRDILDYHASPEDAATSAQAAGAKMLVLSHLVPPIPNRIIYSAFLGDAPEKFDGEIVVGEDGMVFSLPPDGDAIKRSEAM